jgi:hypothetical protein
VMSVVNLSLADCLVWKQAPLQTLRKDPQTWLDM